MSVEVTTLGQEGLQLKKLISVSIAASIGTIRTFSYTQIGMLEPFRNWNDGFMSRSFTFAGDTMRYALDVATF